MMHLAENTQYLARLDLHLRTYVHCEGTDDIYTVFQIVIDCFIWILQNFFHELTQKSSDFLSWLCRLDENLWLLTRRGPHDLWQIRDPFQINAIRPFHQNGNAVRQNLSDIFAVLQ